MDFIVLSTGNFTSAYVHTMLELLSTMSVYQYYSIYNVGLRSKLQQSDVICEQLLCPAP